MKVVFLSVVTRLKIQTLEVQRVCCLDSSGILRTVQGCRHSETSGSKICSDAASTLITKWIVKHFNNSMNSNEKYLLLFKLTHFSNPSYIYGTFDWTSSILFI